MDAGFSWLLTGFRSQREYEILNTEELPNKLMDFWEKWGENPHDPS